MRTDDCLQFLAVYGLVPDPRARMERVVLQCPGHEDRRINRDEHLLAKLAERLGLHDQPCGQRDRH